MERKIGEIFEYNGEWYQCVEGLYCDDCAFVNDNCEDRERITLREKLTKQPTTGFCNSEKRNDRKSVIFKKLEKVGEPYEKRVSDGTFSKFQRYKVYNSVILPKEPYTYCNFIDSTIEIEIKQIKDMGDNNIRPYDELFSSGTVSNTKYLTKEDMEEDMEERYKILEDLVNQYMKADIVYKEFEEGIEKWHKKYGKNTEKKLNFKPFDLEAAKLGKPVCTRNGRKARIICFDAKFPKTGNIVTLVEKENGEEVTLYHYDDGHCSIGRGYDLMMSTEKKEGWINIYKGGLLDTKSYSSKEEAVSKASQTDYINTIKIEWRE